MIITIKTLHNGETLEFSKVTNGYIAFRIYQDGKCHDDLDLVCVKIMDLIKIVNVLK